MNPLRKILADSHVSAIAIAVLLFWALDSAFWALWGPLSRATSFLFKAVAILDIPYFLHFVGIFTSPVAGWISRKQYGGLVPGTNSLPGFSLQDALPELVRFVLLLLVWYVLLRWLYFEPLKKETCAPMPSPEQAA